MMCQGNTVMMFQLKCLNRFLTKYLEKFVMVDMLEEVEDLEVLEEAMDLLVALVEDLVVGLAFRIDHADRNQQLYIYLSKLKKELYLKE